MLTDKQQRFVEFDNFYVYFLIDPRDGEVFYVGKGKGNRVSQHVRNVRSGKIDNGTKCLRIAQILDTGLVPIEHIHADNLTEEEAFSLERSIIREKRDGLTNISNGLVTSEQAARAMAMEMLNRLKGYEHWVRTARAEVLDWTIKSYGSADIFYRKFKSHLEYVAHHPWPRVLTTKV